MGYAIMRWEKLKSVNAVNARLKHNTLSKLPKSERPPINELKGTAHRQGIKYSDFINKATDGKKVRKNAVRAVELVLTFSPNSIKGEDLGEWIKLSLGWVLEQFGGRDNIYSCQLHTHETTPHLHIMLAPIHEHKLNASHYFDGIEKCRQLQDSYADKVAPLGLERGISKQLTHRRYETAQQYRRRLALEQPEKAEYEAYKAVFGRSRDEWYKLSPTAENEFQEAFRAFQTYGTPNKNDPDRSR